MTKTDVPISSRLHGRGPFNPTLNTIAYCYLRDRWSSVRLVTFERYRRRIIGRTKGQRTLGALHVALGILFLSWTVRAGFITLALFALAYGVCDGATIALRPAVIADHFNGPNLAAVTGLHYTSSMLGPLIGPAAFGYSVDFWNSDLIVSCMATVCLVAAGYLFATKPPQRRLRRPGICWPQPCHTKIRGFIEFQPLALPTA